MMRSRQVVLSFVFALPVLLAAQPAAAQDTSLGDVFLGYTFLGNDDLAVNSSNLPWGWAGGGEYRVNEWFSLAIDVGGNYKYGLDPCGVDQPLGNPQCRLLEGVETPAPTVEFQALSFHRTEREYCSARLQPTEALPDNPGCEVSLNSASLAGGPRLSLRTGNVRVFAHVMPGIVRSTRSIDFYTHTAVNFAIVPGGGVEIDINDQVSIRFQGDFRRVFFPDPDNSNSSLVDRNDHNEFRFMTGFSFKVGER